MQLLSGTALLAGGLAATATSTAFVLGAPRASLPAVGIAVGVSASPSASVPQGALLATALAGGALAGAASVSARRQGRRACTAVRAGEQEIQKLRQQLASAKEKEALIKFRMTAAEQAEKQLGDRIMKMDEEKARVAAMLKEVEEKVARAQAETEAKVAEVKRLAEEERKRLVAAALSEVRKEAGSEVSDSTAPGRGAVLSMLMGIEAQANRSANTWFPHVLDTESFAGGYTPW